MWETITNFTRIYMITDANGNEIVLKDEVNTSGTMSLTEGLKERRIKLSSVKVGKLFIELGVFQLKERRSTATNEIKYFKVISDEWLSYGRNIKGLHNQSSPVFYKDKFLDLCLKTKLIQS